MKIVFSATTNAGMAFCGITLEPSDVGSVEIGGIGGPENTVVELDGN